MKLTDIDIERIRADTPGISQSCHLLASGSALMPKQVVDAVVDYTHLEAAMGGYEAESEQAEKLNAIYHQVAGLIGGKPNEVAILENATVAWCQAFYSLSLKQGDRVLTCEAEYAANYVAFLQRQKRDGIVIDIVPSDEFGSIDLDALTEMIDDRVKLIAITWVPTNGGLVNPAQKVGDIAKNNGIPYLLDACQAVGQMPINVSSIGCDFLTATGRKFLRGPRGTGFLYIREERLGENEPVMIDHFAAPWTARDSYTLRTDARCFESWENSYALRAGLNAAIQYAVDIGLDAIQDRAWSLAAYLREQLSSIPGVQTRDIGTVKCAIVSFIIEGHEPSAVVKALRQKDIVIGASEPSSTRLDSERRGLSVVLRAAPHYYNTFEEIDRLLSALNQISR